VFLGEEEESEAAGFLSGRDTTLSIFHSIGKILHARLGEPLSLSPELIAERCGLEHGMFAEFVHHNCVDLLPPGDTDSLVMALECVSFGDVCLQVCAAFFIIIIKPPL
jgi:hypothetical protein